MYKYIEYDSNGKKTDTWYGDESGNQYIQLTNDEAMSDDEFKDLMKLHEKGEDTSKYAQKYYYYDDPNGKDYLIYVNSKGQIKKYRTGGTGTEKGEDNKEELYFKSGINKYLKKDAKEADIDTSYFYNSSSNSPEEEEKITLPTTMADLLAGSKELDAWGSHYGYDQIMKYTDDDAALVGVKMDSGQPLLHSLYINEQTHEIEGGYPFGSSLYGDSAYYPERFVGKNYKWNEEDGTVSTLGSDTPILKPFAGSPFQSTSGDFYDRAQIMQSKQTLKYDKNYIYWGDVKFAINSFPMDEYWKTTIPKQFDTGGYTGQWGPEGKMAILHEKEIVLNKKDTENILATVSIVRELDTIINSMVASINGMYSSVLANGIPQIPTTNNNEGIQQSITIHAEFPNAESAYEIETALKNLTLDASQYVDTWGD